MSDNGQQRIKSASELDLSADLHRSRHSRGHLAYPNAQMRRLLVSDAPIPWWRWVLQRVRLWIATH